MNCFPFVTPSPVPPGQDRFSWLRFPLLGFGGLKLLAPLVAMVFVLGTGSAFGAESQSQSQFRFPPPEFESGYQLPATATPGPRSIWFQHLDVLVLLAVLGLAVHLVLKKRSRRGVFALSIFSLIYFGFYRKGCVCSIGSIQNVALALFQSNYAIPFTVLAFFVAPLAVALFAGRAFCAAACPHGAFQDLMLLKPLKVPAWLEQALSVVPFIYLGAAVLFAATASDFIICVYDPFVPIFRLGGSFTMLAIGVSFLLLAMFVGRPYCRFLCPYGALLRLTSMVSKWRVTVTPNVCNQCRLCENACPYGAMREPMSPPAGPQILALDRRRLGRLLLLLPVMVAAGGWVGSVLAPAASQVHPKVKLAERYVQYQEHPVPLTPQTAESLSLQRAEKNPKGLLADAVAIREDFLVGGWIFGGWIGLVVGAKLISLSVRRRRTDYEPDAGACLACARCFSSCPNERVRKGLAPVLGLQNIAPAPEPLVRTS